MLSAHGTNSYEPDEPSAISWCSGHLNSHLSQFGQSQGEELGKDEGSLNTVRGVGKRVAEIALRMAASAK